MTSRWKSASLRWTKIHVIVGDFVLLGIPTEGIQLDTEWQPECEDKASAPANNGMCFMIFINVTTSTLSNDIRRIDIRNQIYIPLIVAQRMEKTIFKMVTFFLDSEENN